MEKVRVGWRKYSWSPCLKYRGTGDPYYYDNFDDALDALLQEVRFSVIDNSGPF